jgi:ATP-dependent Clp protease ATP-binding subunit ClpA
VAVDVLRKVGADLDKLRSDLKAFIESTTPLIPAGDSSRETQPTLGFQRVLQRAVFHVQSSGRKEVTGANVLVAIFSEQESQAVFFLKQQNIARIDVVNYIAHGISKVGGEGEGGSGGQEQDDEGGQGEGAQPERARGVRDQSQRAGQGGSHRSRWSGATWNWSA